MTGFIDTNDILAALIRYAGYVVLFRYVLGYPFRSAKWAAAGIAGLTLLAGLNPWMWSWPLIDITGSYGILPGPHFVFLCIVGLLYVCFDKIKISPIVFFCAAYSVFLDFFFIVIDQADFVPKQSRVVMTALLITGFICILSFLIKLKAAEIYKVLITIPGYLYWIFAISIYFTKNFYYSIGSIEHFRKQVEWFNMMNHEMTNILLIFAFLSILIIHGQRKQLKKRDEANTRLIKGQTNQWKLQNERQKELRAFRHDLAAHTLALQNLSKQKQYDKLDAYIDKLAAVQKSAFYISTNHIIGDAILNEYHRRGQEDGVEVQVVGMFPEGMKMEEMDLCTILSNLMSNAYEATLKTDVEGERTIRVKIGTYEDRVFLTIENPFIGEMQIEDGELMTSKEDKEGHGYGIQNVKKALEKYGGTISWEIRNVAESSKYYVAKVTF